MLRQESCTMLDTTVVTGILSNSGFIKGDWWIGVSGVFPTTDFVIFFGESFTPLKPKSSPRRNEWDT